MADALEGSIPTTDSVAGRVDLVLSYLVDQYRTTGENALVLFLSALAENYDPATRLHGQLLDLAMNLAEAKSDEASLGRLQREVADLEAEAARKNTPLNKAAEGTASAPASAEASAGAIAHIPSSLPAWIDRLLHLWLWLYYLVFVSGVVLSFVANLGSTLGLSSCVQQRMLTALVFMGGAVILGLSFLPKLKANYRNWDRMVTACLCLMVTTYRVIYLMPLVLWVPLKVQTISRPQLHHQSLFQYPLALLMMLICSTRICNGMLAALKQVSMLYLHLPIRSA